MADRKWSAYPTATTAALNDLVSFLDVSEPTLALINQTMTITDFRTLMASSSWLEPVLSEIDFVTAEPPAPSIGDRHIATATGLSSVTGQSITINNVYDWNGVDWTETVVNEGDVAYVDDVNLTKTFNGVAWVATSNLLKKVGNLLSPIDGGDSFSVGSNTVTAGLISLTGARTIFSDVNNSFSTLGGGISSANGASLKLYGITHALLPGYADLTYGDNTQVSNASAFVRFMSNGSTVDVMEFTPNANANVINDLFVGSDIGATANRVTKGWFDDIEVTNMPTVSGASINANGVLSLSTTQVTRLSVIDQNLATTDSPAFVGLTLSGLADGIVKSTAGILSGGGIVSLTAEVSGILPVTNGGTNATTALTNDKVVVSNSGRIEESAVTTTQLAAAVASGTFVGGPITPTSPGTQGENYWDGTYKYECVATNTWVRDIRATSW